MSQSDQDEKPFTVSDRRHFTPEGRPREDAEATGASEAPREEASPTARAEAHEPQAEKPRAEASPETGSRGAPAGPADFSQFVAGLAAQAGALLSGEGLPEGVDAREALDGARSLVSVLEMLKDKTAGNLSGPEASLLDEVLFQLRMAYVEKTRAGGA